MRWGGIDIKLSWVVAFEALIKAKIDNVYVNEIYPTRLYFKVEDKDDDVPFNITQSQLNNIGMDKFTIDISNNLYAIGSPPNFTDSSPTLNPDDSTSFYITATSGYFNMEPKKNHFHLSPTMY